MDFLIGIHDMLYAKMGVVLYYVLFLMVVVGAMAQYRLYTKAGQPGYTALVPVLNLVVFLKIVGRPSKDGWSSHPVWGQFYFLPKVWIEVCKSFGKTSTLDYVLVIVLNDWHLEPCIGRGYPIHGPLYGRKGTAPPRKLSRPFAITGLRAWTS
ncbi:MAG: hypothetical protein IPN38_17860 [Flavobacteriales bacterium]|nr:hypothetical protein [Flavobacteriales bacterium]